MTIQLEVAIADIPISRGSGSFPVRYKKWMEGEMNLPTFIYRSGKERKRKKWKRRSYLLFPAGIAHLQEYPLPVHPFLPPFTPISLSPGLPVFTSRFNVPQGDRLVSSSE